MRALFQEWKLKNCCIWLGETRPRKRFYWLAMALLPHSSSDALCYGGGSNDWSAGTEVENRKFLLR